MNSHALLPHFDRVGTKASESECKIRAWNISSNSSHAPKMLRMVLTAVSDHPALPLPSNPGRPSLQGTRASE
jgi:hypothetical protein